MVGNVGKVNIPRLDLAKLPESKAVSSTQTQNLDKAPRLGFFNAIKIGLQAFGQSLTSDKDYGTIRTALKKEIINTKIEQRNERLVEKFQGTEQERMALKGELKDKFNARLMNLPTTPTTLIDTIQYKERAAIDKSNSGSVTRTEFSKILPDKKLGDNPEKVKTHFSNLIDRIVEELNTKGVSKEDRVAVFRDVFTRFAIENFSLSDMMELKLGAFTSTAGQFKAENRPEKQQFMEIMANVLSQFSDPKSDVAQKVREMGQKQLEKSLLSLPPTGHTNFLRDKACDQFNMNLVIQGGNKLTAVTKDFARNLPSNESFETLVNVVNSIAPGEKANALTFKNNSMTPDCMDLFGDIVIDLFESLKTNDQFSDFRNALAQVKDLFVDAAATGKVSEEVAQRGNKIFGEASILLRFVVPFVATEKLGGIPENQKSLILVGAFLQAVANDVGAPAAFDEETKNAYNLNATRVKEKIEDFLSSLNVPTPDQLSEAINEKKVVLKQVNDLVNALPQVPVDPGKGDVGASETVPETEDLFSDIDRLLDDIEGTTVDRLRTTGLSDSTPLSKEDQEVLEDFRGFLKGLDNPPSGSSVDSGKGKTTDQN